MSYTIIHKVCIIGIFIFLKVDNKENTNLKHHGKRNFTLKLIQLLVITVRNEVANVMFLHLSVSHSVHKRGGAIPACIAGGIPACLAGGSAPGGRGSAPGWWGSAPGGVPALGGACSGGLLLRGGA